MSSVTQNLVRFPAIGGLVMSSLRNPGYDVIIGHAISCQNSQSMGTVAHPLEDLQLYNSQDDGKVWVFDVVILCMALVIAHKTEIGVFYYLHFLHYFLLVIYCDELVTW